MDALASLIHDWKDIIDTLITYGTAVGVFWTVRKIRRDNQQISIIAVNADSKEERHITRLPRHQVTRGEVLGTLRLEAGGKQLDTHLFRWNEHFRDEVRVLLPGPSFAFLRDTGAVS